MIILHKQRGAYFIVCLSHGYTSFHTSMDGKESWKEKPTEGEGKRSKGISSLCDLKFSADIIVYQRDSFIFCYFDSSAGDARDKNRKFSFFCEWIEVLRYSAALCELRLGEWVGDECSFDICSWIHSDPNWFICLFDEGNFSRAKNICRASLAPFNTCFPSPQLDIKWQLSYVLATKNFTLN